MTKDLIHQNWDERGEEKPNKKHPNWNTQKWGWLEQKNWSLYFFFFLPMRFIVRLMAKDKTCKFTDSW